jgi:hypothetical protein
MVESGLNLEGKVTALLDTAEKKIQKACEGKVERLIDTLI